MKRGRLAAQHQGTFVGGRGAVEVEASRGLREVEPGRGHLGDRGGVGSRSRRAGGAGDVGSVFYGWNWLHPGSRAGLKMGVFVERLANVARRARPTAQFEAHPPSSSRAMELQKRAFELVVENMLPGLDAELGTFEELSNIFGTSRLANRRRVLQWVGTHYLVVGAAKLNELRRVCEELEVAREARMAAWTAEEMPHVRDFDEAEYWRAILTYDRINEEKSRLSIFFKGRGHWAWMFDMPFTSWRDVLLFTLTKWSRLRD